MRTILIADDSITARMILKRCLEMIGLKDCRIVEAKDGQEALEMVGAEPPDLILADLNMPRRNGEDLLQRLKESDATRAIPVVIASSSVNPVRNERLMALGAHGIVAKPVSPAGLRQALGALAGN
ncbi:MAG TPA: response regulator [Fibrobacteria bacterium]|nr:response regulator [Fibrobacteria bacterium]